MRELVRAKEAEYADLRGRWKKYAPGSPEEAAFVDEAALYRRVGEMEHLGAMKQRAWIMGDSNQEEVIRAQEERTLFPPPDVQRQQETRHEQLGSEKARKRYLQESDSLSRTIHGTTHGTAAAGITPGITTLEGTHIQLLRARYEGTPLTQALQQTTTPNTLQGLIEDPTRLLRDEIEGIALKVVAARMEDIINTPRPKK
jgi:hypothetical protein